MHTLGAWCWTCFIQTLPLVIVFLNFEVALNRALADLHIPSANRLLIERSIGKGSEHLIRAVLKHQLALPEVAVNAGEVEQLFTPVWERY